MSDPKGPYRETPRAPSATPRTDEVERAHGLAWFGLTDELGRYQDAAGKFREIARSLERELAEANACVHELNRRLSVILDLVDGKVDVEDGEDRPRPNIFMQIETAAEGRDQP